ncbi:MAG: hypothetical protein Q4B60_06835 [Erysipelotrichaceae bacterium]|nr:hypothetical protein [Erysipelotrichaceae bacterium]
MKKLLTLLVLVCMVFSLGACGSKTEDNNTPAGNDTPAEATYKLGMGTTVSLDSSKAGNAQVDATVAAVILDAEGKIVDCRIDVAQNKTAISEDGEIATEGVTFLSKYEKGEDYHMDDFAEDCTRDWYLQADSFAAYVVGKTAAEVEATETRVRGEDEPHPGYVVAADETLFAECSITITQFIEAVVKACNDEQGKTFTTAGTPTLGLKLTSNLDKSSKSATAEEAGAANMYTTMSAAAVVDGTIVAAVLDAMQPKISFDDCGEITDAKFVATKRELKEDYNMVKFAEDCNIEWYQQSANFTDYCAGKTAAEVLATETRTRGEDEPHPGYVVAADEALFAQCSINIVDLMQVVADAANNAK